MMDGGRCGDEVPIRIHTLGFRYVSPLQTDEQEVLRCLLRSGLVEDVLMTCYKCDLGEHLDCEDRDCTCCGPTNGYDNESYEAHGRSAAPPSCNCDWCKREEAST